MYISIVIQQSFKSVEKQINKYKIKKEREKKVLLLQCAIMPFIAVL